LSGGVLLLFFLCVCHIHYTNKKKENESGEGGGLESLEHKLHTYDKKELGSFEREETNIFNKEAKKIE